MSDGWGLNTREHTFSTGRSATLRRSVNVFAVGTETGLGLDMVDGAHDPDLTMGQVVLGILQYLWVIPRVLGPGEKAGKTPSVGFADLDTAEVMESLELWKEAAEKAGRFRGDTPRTGGGEGREGVGSGSKPASRARGGKSGSTPR